MKMPKVKTLDPSFAHDNFFFLMCISLFVQKCCLKTSMHVVGSQNKPEYVTSFEKLFSNFFILIGQNF